MERDGGIGWVISGMLECWKREREADEEGFEGTTRMVVEWQIVLRWDWIGIV